MPARRLIHGQLWYTIRTVKCHPFLFLHLGGPECRTEPQLVNSHAPCSILLRCQAKRWTQLALFPLPCKYAASAHICPSSRQPRGSSRNNHVIISSEGQDGIMWPCQYTAKMEMVSTFKAGTARPAHLHQVSVPEGAAWALSLLLCSFPKDGFKSMFETQRTEKLLASIFHL